jgi:hypothetical protein
MTNKFQCEHCKRNFASKQSLQRHCTKSTCATQAFSLREYECEGCEECLKGLNAYESHISKCRAYKKVIYLRGLLECKDRTIEKLAEAQDKEIQKLTKAKDEEIERLFKLADKPRVTNNNITFALLDGKAAISFISQELEDHIYFNLDGDMVYEGLEPIVDLLFNPDSPLHNAVFCSDLPRAVGYYNMLLDGKTFQVRDAGFDNFMTKILELIVRKAYDICVMEKQKCDKMLEKGTLKKWLYKRHMSEIDGFYKWSQDPMKNKSLFKEKIKKFRRLIALKTYEPQMIEVGTKN